MPWKPSDAQSHTSKATTDKLREQWASTANNARKQCLAEGGSEEVCDAQAIRIANAAISQASESEEVESEAPPILQEQAMTNDTELVALEEEQAIDEAPQSDDEGSAIEEAAGEVELQEVEGDAIEIEESDEDILGDVIPLVESAGSDGTVLLKLITPGWGSSGYYSKSVLKRDGPKVFTAGTQQFWDHPTLDEQAARPEGSLRNLAAKLVENAKWMDRGPKGPGLYARSKIYSSFREGVKELQEDLGVSIRAAGKFEIGEAEGRTGRLVKEITSRRSVDFVTLPGAGGGVAELFESYRSAESQLRESNRESSPEPHASGITEKETGMEHDAKVEGSGEATRQPDSSTVVREARTLGAIEGMTLEEARRTAQAFTARNEALEAQNTTLRENLRDADTREAGLKLEISRLNATLGRYRAREFVESKLNDHELDPHLHRRLLSTIPKMLKIEEGNIREADASPIVERHIKEEVDYWAKVSGSGNVQNMGGEGMSESLNLEDELKALQVEYQRSGLNERQARLAAYGRGR